MIAALSVSAVLFGASMLALEIGFRVGRRHHRTDAGGSGSQVGAIQGAVLGLLALLLAFTFAAAGTRFLERQDLIVQEANAIGTAYLRSDLLDEPSRSELRAALKDYTEQRIEAARRQTGGWEPSMLSEAERSHGRIWNAARAGVAARPETAVVLLPPVNEIIDVHSTRVAALDKHVPGPVMLLLTACSLIAVASIGYGCGLEGRRRLPLTVPLALLVACSLWLTIDLDNPRRGLLRLSDAPLQALKFDTP